VQAFFGFFDRTRVVHVTARHWGKMRPGASHSGPLVADGSRLVRAALREKQCGLPLTPTNRSVGRPSFAGEGKGGSPDTLAAPKEGEEWGHASKRSFGKTSPKVMT
jgi:hypothetical protein